jgi:hypothetical protein
VATAGCGLAATAFAAAILAGIGLLGMLLPGLAPVRGASQRVAEAAIFGWIVHASLSLLRSRADALPKASGRP